MPTSFADSYFVYSPHKLMFIIAFLTISLYLFVMKTLFGSYSLPHVVSLYKTNKKISEKYHSLFATRDNLLFHISWAKSRGDFEEAKTMTKDLISLDKVVKYEIILIFYVILHVYLS